MRNRLNILLVDDQPAKLLTYEAILQGLDEHLIKATSATQALDCLLKHEIAVVLTDVCMPDLDGYELAAMIREHPRHQKTSIIFISAVLMTDLDHLRGYESGAVDYVPVPIVPEILRAKVSVFADLYRKTKQLERMNDELEQRVAERTAQLEAAALRLRDNEERLREADRRKDEFLAMLAHELRNPLAPIRTAAQLLRVPQLPETQRARARDIIEHQVAHMVHLIDELMDVSRITRGVITLKDEPVDLSVVVARAVETARPIIDECRHDLTLELPAQSIALRGDETRLAQVLANLLTNAAKYTDDGGRIGVAVTVVPREAGAAPEGDDQDRWSRTPPADIEIRVTDTGIGIAPQDLTKVFELFTQAHERTERPRGGLGIGLALVQRLVEMHGGSVSAFSDGPGLGAEFIVRLPLWAIEETPPASPQEPFDPLADRSGAPKRVLIVDDNADAAEAVTMLLSAAGHEVRVAYDGLDGLEAGERFAPDVVLLDLGMPRLNGVDAAQRIRRSAWGRSARLIALTGWGQDRDRARTSAAGFDLHLVKPVADGELLRAVSGSPRVTRTPDVEQTPGVGSAESL